MKKIEITSLEDAKDKILGKVGTGRRDAYEEEMKESLIGMEYPLPENYGFHSSSTFDEQSGWQFEGGEEAYYKALELYNELNKPDEAD